MAFLSRLKLLCYLLNCIDDVLYRTELAEEKNSIKMAKEKEKANELFENNKLYREYSNEV